MSRRTIIALFLIVILGGALRFIGLNFGFPALLHPDEPTTVRRALAFFQGDFNPHWFSIPSLYLYLLYFSYWLYYRLGEAVGAFSSLSHFRQAELSFYLIGRIWSAALGTATVPLVYLVGKKVYGKISGFGGALLLTVLPLHVLHSHYATVDVPVTFMVTLSFLFSVMVMRKGKTASYLLGGVCAGLAAGMKYNGSLALFPLAAAHFLREKKIAPSPARARRSSHSLAPLLGGLASAGLTFFLSSPFIIKEQAKFLADLRAMSNYLIRSGHGPIFIATDPGALYQITHNLYYSGGMAFLLLSLSGVIWALIQHRRSDLLIFSWILPYFILISIPVVKFSRFFIPLLPFLSILAARLLEIDCRRAWLGRSRALIFAGAWLWMFFYAAGVTRMLARPDARLAAENWIDETLPRGSRIGLIQTETGLIFLDDPIREASHPRFKIERYKREVAALQARPDYLIVTNFDYSDILRLKAKYDQKRCDLWNSLLREEEGYKKIKEFWQPPRFWFFTFSGANPPHDMLYNCPRITIFRREK